MKTPFSPLGQSIKIIGMSYFSQTFSLYYSVANVKYPQRDKIIGQMKEVEKMATTIALNCWLPLFGSHTCSQSHIQQ